jgi:MarR family transcriptional regulator, organic hydroperoxide resistance regulator
MTTARPTARNDALLDAGEVLEFIRLLWAVAHGLQRTSKHMAMRLGVTGPQRFVLRMIGRFPDVTPGRLARLLHVHPSTLTEILRRLESQNLVQRCHDTQDRRRVLLVLTRRGRALNKRLEGTIEAAVARLLSETDPTTLDASRQVLRRLAELLRAVTAGDRRGRDRG